MIQFYYDNELKLFSLTRPFTNQLTAYLIKYKDFCERILDIKRILTKANQVDTGNKLVSLDMDYDGATWDYRSLYYFGATSIGDILAINYKNGEIIRFRVDNNRGEWDVEGQDMLSWVKSQVNVSRLDRKDQKQYEDFINNLHNNI